MTETNVKVLRTHDVPHWGRWTLTPGSVPMLKTQLLYHSDAEETYSSLHVLPKPPLHL
jgi:hypothetical protein